MTSSAAQPTLTAEVLNELKIMSEDAFQRLEQGVALLQVRQVTGLLAEIRNSQPDRAAQLAPLYAIRYDSSLLAAADPFAVLEDAWGWFELMEGLLHHYTGERSRSSAAPEVPAVEVPQYLSGPVQALYEFAARLTLHQDLIDGLSPDNAVGHLDQLGANAARLQVLHGELKPADRLIQAVHACRQDIAQEWEQVKP